MSEARTAEPVQQRRSVFARTSALLGSDIVANAMSLYGSTIVTSFLGFAYWWLAARLLPVESVGAASAAIAAMSFIATFSMLGFNTLVLAELPRLHPSDRRHFLASTTGGAIVASLVAGGVVGQVLAHTSAVLAPLLGTVVGTSVFAFAVAATTAAAIVDDAAVGLLRARWQLRRNTAFALGKLALVPAAAIGTLALHGFGLLTGWALAAAVTVGVLYYRLAPRVRGTDRTARPRMASTLWRYRSTALGHHWLNVAVQAPRLILPVVAAVVLGPLETAAFYVASLLINFISTIPWHLSTVLFAIGVGDTERLRRETRLTMRISAALALVSAPLVWLTSRFDLGVFHGSYTVAAAAMAVLGLTTFPSAVKSHYVAISRVQGRLARAALLASVGAALEIGLATVGGLTHGLIGIAVAQLLAQAVQAAFFAPSVWRVVRTAAPR